VHPATVTARHPQRAEVGEISRSNHPHG